MDWTNQFDQYRVGWRYGARPVRSGRDNRDVDSWRRILDVVVDPDLLDDASDYLTNTATVAADGLNFNGYTITVNDQSDTGSGFDNDEPTSTIVPEIADMLTLFDDIEAEFGSAYLNVTGLAVQTSRVPEQLQRQILLGKAIQR